MPIEIRELHIKAVVDAGGERKGDAGESVVRPAQGTGEAANDEFINLCVEKVLEILKQKTDR
jgi:hypothetical protein